PRKDTQRKELPKVQTKLWAAISVNQPVVLAKGTMTELFVSIAIVNDGDKTVDPEIGSSHLFVNGKEWKNWAFSVGQGPRDDRFTALPPRNYVGKTFDFAEHCTKPGIYRLLWKGRGFQAPEVVF